MNPAEAGHFDDSAELRIGSRFAGFQIEALIGRGGMGAVYLARDLALDHERALKILDARLAHDSGFRERFQRESRLAAAIEDPALVPIHRAGEEGGRLFIAMRLVRGPDLNRLVAKDGPIEPQRTARMIGAVASALDAAHKRGIVHRDVKPGNVLVELTGEGERVYLTDFGIGRAASAGEPITSTGELIGTAEYIAPEQIEGRPAEPRSDVYALGCVAFFLLTAESPFARETQMATLYAHSNAPRPRPSAIRPGIPHGVDEVIVKATAISPDQRYQFAGELAADLAQAVRGESVATAVLEAEGAGATPTEANGSGRRAIVVGLGLVAALIAAIVIFLVPGEEEQLGASADVETVFVDGAPVSSLVVGKVNVVVVAKNSSQLFAIDPDTNDVVRGPETIPRPSSVAVGFKSVWVTSAKDDVLLRYGPPSRSVAARIPVGNSPADIAIDENWVWVANRGDGTVSQVHPKKLEVKERVHVGGAPEAIAAAGGDVWVASPSTGAISRINPTEPEAPVKIGKRPTDLSLGAGSLWVVDAELGVLTEASPDSGAPRGEPVDLDGAPVAVDVGLGGVWVVDSETGTLTKVDSETHALAEPIHVGKRPTTLEVGADSVWVANTGGGNVARLTP